MAPNGPARLAEKIAKAEPTQGAAAEKLGISDGHLSDLLSGRRTPSLTLALKIHDVYGIPPASWQKAS